MSTRWLNWSAMDGVTVAESHRVGGQRARVAVGAAVGEVLPDDRACPAVTSMTRLCPESVIRVWPLGRRLAKAANWSGRVTDGLPLPYCQTMWPARVISMTRLLFSSAMRMWPLGSSSALLGLLSAPGPDAGPYDHTIVLLNRSTSMTRLLPWSTTMMSRLGSWIANTGTLSWFGPEPVTPAWPYCQTMLPAWSTTMTRLSAQLKLGSAGDAPSGTPVPASRVRPSPSRSASLVPMIAPGPGLHSDGLPGPEAPDDRSVSGSTSIARLLYWSVIRRLPGALKSACGPLPLSTLATRGAPRGTEPPGTASTTPHQEQICASLTSRNERHERHSRRRLGGGKATLVLRHGGSLPGRCPWRSRLRPYTRGGCAERE